MDQREQEKQAGWDVLSTLVMEHQQGLMGVGDFLGDSTVRLGCNDVGIYDDICNEMWRYIENINGINPLPIFAESFYFILVDFL